MGDNMSMKDKDNAVKQEGFKMDTQTKFKHVEKTSIGNRYGKDCIVCGKFFTVHIAPGVPTAWADKNYTACPKCSNQ